MWKKCEKDNTKKCDLWNNKIENNNNTVDHKNI
jgi:hypothetical protein